MVMVRSVKLGKKKALIIGGVVALVLLAGVAAWFVIAQKINSPLPRDFIESVNFPVYYSSTLPADYTLDKESIDSDGVAAHYTVSNPKKKITITVTQQATPSGFDAAKIIGSAPIPTRISTSGTLYNLSIGASSKYMFTTGGATLVFLTSPSTIPSEDINAFIDNFKKAE
jgi:hypothetical protein